ncbi:MurR/RpiR family transcriptional regulator [Pontibacillus sp. HMF3514]|uniref:MurR/RpiR family transcriptional regulator n=1 Tax=Pontibacillus sp. HMF3514 TaxID=2692425 RepID=UPI00131FDB2F|nr:MurR/RpiR family transcriptional regulator [Pontibacillus sp. HMF3514]QHE52801.1 SIS domain-containing protein [Pontibacillus sp. HMF3514]
MQNVYQHISAKIPEMSKSQKRIATYILENPNTAPFLNVAKLAKLSGVSEATTVRFANFLGFSGYPELQQQLQQSVQQQLTTYERLEMSTQVYDDEEKGIYEIFQDDMTNIKTTMEKLDLHSFHQIVDILLNADRVFIVANRSALSLGVFLQYYLNMILGNTELIQTIETKTESLNTLNENDVVIGMSFARYTKSTIDIIQYAREKGASTVAITDHLLSPLVPYVDYSLVASTKMPTFLDSFVAPLSLINALVTYVGKHKTKDFQERLKQLEETWNHFDIFIK